MQARVSLLARFAQTRQAALFRLDGDDAADVYAARRVLLQDPDGRVRAGAARFLGRARAVSPVRFLLDATYDALPLVRQAAVSALGRQAALGAHFSQARLVRLALTDEVWSVRRTALCALCAVGQAAAISTLKEGLGDPFWRVRHAAVKCLVRLWHAWPAERDRIVQAHPSMSEACQSAHLEVLSQVRPELAAYKAPAPRAVDHELLNPDPAVTTARLLDRGSRDVTPAELVPLLSEPHAPLRRLAVELLSKNIREAELEALLPYLALPGPPHALEATIDLLSRLGKRSFALCGRVLGDPDSPVGAVLWACRTLAQQGLGRPWVKGALLHKHPVARLCAVYTLDQLGETDPAVFERLAEDEDSEVRNAALAALLPRLSDSQWARHLPELLGPESHPLTRLCVLARAAQGRDRVLLSHLAQDDAHPLVQARALRALGTLGALPCPQAERHLQNADPLIREAVLAFVSDAEIVHRVLADPDPVVRRQALRQAYRRREQLSLPLRKQLSQVDAQDPWILAHLVPLLSLCDDLPRLLALARHTHSSVRRAAIGRLETAHLAPQLLSLCQSGVLDGNGPETGSGSPRLAALSELMKQAFLSPDRAAALTQVRTLLPACPIDPQEQELVRVLSLLLGKTPMAVETGQKYGPNQTPGPSQTPMPAGGLRRQLGQTGLLVSPLCLSGRHELPVRSFCRALDAGVNVFFWEPTYRALTQFVQNKRSLLHVVTGTYAADTASIVADVDRALRRLRTDYLDLFLLFWVRSPERLTEDGLSALLALKAAGKIRATGFSTHDRELAEQAVGRVGQEGNADFDVLMTRHSAAHPGAEKRLFPLCQQKRIGLMTFSATSYGRLLQNQTTPRGASEPRLSSADCYRYSLSQPGVATVISAPRYPSELSENLAVLADDSLSQQAADRLIARGQEVYAQSRRTNALVRRGHQSPLYAPGEQATLSMRLASLLAEHPAPPSEPLAEVLSRRHPRPERPS